MEEAIVRGVTSTQPKGNDPMENYVTVIDKYGDEGHWVTINGRPVFIKHR